jgi:hypothetical protein
LRRPGEGPEQVLEIFAGGVNVLFTVQQPHEVMQSQAKSGGSTCTPVMASGES